MKISPLKKATFNLSVLAFVFLAIFVSCSKEEEDKPDDQFGKDNYVTYQMNGQNFDHSAHMNLSHGLSNFWIQTESSSDYPKNTLNIYISDTMGTGIYHFQDRSPMTIDFWEHQTESKIIIYSDMKGTFTLEKADSKKEVYSGNFEFTAYNKLDKNDSIIIKNGKFNVVSD